MFSVDKKKKIGESTAEALPILILPLTLEILVVTILYCIVESSSRPSIYTYVFWEAVEEYFLKSPRRDLIRIKQDKTSLILSHSLSLGIHIQPTNLNSCLPNK